MHIKLRPSNMEAHIIRTLKCIANGMSHGEIRSMPNNCFIGAHNILSCPAITM